jgi:hypothetical protein
VESKVGVNRFCLISRVGFGWQTVFPPPNSLPKRPKGWNDKVESQVWLQTIGSPERIDDRMQENGLAYS